MKMRISIFIILILICFSGSIAQNYTTILSINTGGHKSLIKDLALSKDGKYLVSTGDDKVIKIWNTETGELEQEIFGENQEGEDGKILSMVLSPDNKYLAVSGGTMDDKYKTVVRLYDFQARKLINILHAANDRSTFFYAMTFSFDSRYLLAGTDTNEITAWEMKSKELAATWKVPTYRDLCIQVRDSLLVTSSIDSTVMLWNMYQGKAIKTLRKAHNGVAYYVNFSPDGKYILSVGYDKKINVYDNQLNLLNTTATDIRPSTIDFSPNGTKVLMGFGEFGAQHCQIYDFKEGKLKLLANFEGHKEIVLATKFLNDSTAISAGGEDNEIFFWRWGKPLNGKPTKTTVIMKLVGKGHAVWGVAMTGRTVAFTVDKTGNYGSSVLNNTFDLFTHEIKPVTSVPQKFGGPVHSYGEYSIKHEKGGSLGYIDADLVIRKSGKEIGRIKRDVNNRFDGGIRHHSYTLVQDKYVITGGDNGNLVAYDLNGNLISLFSGHAGRIWSVTVSDDGKYIISGTSDQTIKIWRTEDIGKKSREPLLSIAEAFTHESWLKYFEELGIMPLAKEKARPAWQQVIKTIREKGNNADATILENYFYWTDKDVIKPVASIFISDDHEWVTWCDDGYFTSSKRGGKYIGYHVNKGYDQEAKVYPFEQFDLKFNRPDIMMDRLAIADSVTKEAYLLAHKKRLNKMHFEENALLAEIHVPEVIINKTLRKNDTYHLEVTASDSKYALDRIFVTVNDVPVFGSQGLSLIQYNTQEIIREMDIPLQNGKNVIRISVLNNKGGESLMETMVVQNQKERVSKNLYLVSIGVSNYDNKEMNLKYAAKDASDITKLFVSGKKHYDHVYADTIFNIQATAKNIEAIKKKLFSTGVDDQVIIFLAGHGLLDNKLDYYLAMHDVDFNDPSKNGLSYEKLEGLLDSIPARCKALFMDACHSGELDKDEVELASAKKEEKGDIVFRAGGTNTAVKKSGLSRESSFELMKELFTDLRRGVGATVISSAGGTEYAMESAKWNNGVFTYCLLSGLKGAKADLNKDGKIMISELQLYLQKAVPELTGGRQRPTSRVENINNDWQVW
jgi:WD40 repeat protein